MPPRIPGASVGWRRSFQTPPSLKSQHICPICSISRVPRRPLSKRVQRKALSRPRFAFQQLYSSASDVASTDSPTEKAKLERTALREALLELRKHAANYLNVSRLQLALRGLEQPEGQETIRIAILGLADGGASLKQAKELLRLILADPLKEEEEWEQILIHSDNAGKPLLIRLGHNGSEDLVNSGRLVDELNVSSAMFNGHKLEILVLEMDPPIETSTQSFEEAVLVPTTMEIPTSSSGRYTPVTTPVHRTFLLGQGIMGAASLLSYPLGTNRDTIGTAVNLRVPDAEPLPIPLIDITAGKDALSMFRKSVDNALNYEHQWLSSGIPEVIDWLKSGTRDGQSTIKEPLLKLIYSIIQSAENNLQEARARQLSQLSSTKVSASNLKALRTILSIWSEYAHTELRDELDIAFGGNKWRKLAWWKLFWRVDDVSMITYDMLNRRFLTEAEKEIIFIAGRIEQAGANHSLPLSISEGEDRDWAYRPVDEPLPEGVPPPNLQDLVVVKSDDESETKFRKQPWPQQIPATRTFLSTTTIPALQALAQNLVLQTLSTSSLSSALGVLMYVSNLSTTVYEAGAVAALGIVWSMRRMQTKWETARKYWEGEVREEGRKAVRSIETEVGENLRKAEKDRPMDPVIEQEFDRASTSIKSANALLVDHEQ